MVKRRLFSKTVGGALCPDRFGGYRKSGRHPSQKATARHSKAPPTVFLIVFFPLFALSSTLFANRPPNILFILVDDLAWTDLGCYGHPWHETPNIDQLADEGMQFTQAYSPAPICSSARASILTGKTPARLGLEFVVKAEAGSQLIEPPQPLKAPPFTLALDLAETTIAEQLKSADYNTAYFGKWHLNPHYAGRYLGWDPQLGPAEQGFDMAEEDFGSHPYSRNALPELTVRGQFHRDGITERAISFLKQDHDQAFFLLVSHFYVHTPVQSPYTWLLERYEAKIPEDTPNREKRIEYAAFVKTLDYHVGQLLAALDATGLRDDTLVVFLSDNGGHPEYVSHVPLRGSKWNLYEGGIRVPLLMRWPGTISEKINCDTPVVGYDLFSTFASVAGINEMDTQQDGTSLVPLFAQPSLILDRNLYWHFPYYHPEGDKFGRAKASIGVDDFVVSQTRPHSAIRKGDYKLLHFQEDDRTELYNVKKDPAEERNLALEQAGKTVELAASLESYLDQVNARMAKAQPLKR